MSDDLAAALAEDERFERRLFWRQLAIVLLVVVLVVALILVK